MPENPYALLHFRITPETACDALRLQSGFGTVRKAIKTEIGASDEIVYSDGSNQILVRLAVASESSALRVARIARAALHRSVPGGYERSPKLSCGILLVAETLPEDTKPLSVVRALSKRASSQAGSQIIVDQLAESMFQP